MGCLRSKDQRSDTSIAMESHTQELAEKYHSLQDKLGDISKEFVENRDFEPRLQSLQTTTTNHDRILKKATEERAFQKPQQNTLSQKIDTMEQEVKTQNEKFQQMEEEYTEQVRAYSKALKECYKRIVSLEEEILKGAEAQRLFKLSKAAKVNGIQKSNKGRAHSNKKKQSLQKMPRVSTTETWTSPKTKSALQTREHNNSLTEFDFETGGQANNNLEFLQLSLERTKTQIDCRQTACSNKREEFFSETNMDICKADFTNITITSDQ